MSGIITVLGLVMFLVLAPVRSPGGAVTPMPDSAAAAPLPVSADMDVITPISRLALDEARDHPMIDNISAVPADISAEPIIETAAPDLTSTSAFAVDITTGELLYQQQPDEQSAPASTVKIVTAMVVIEVLEMDEEIVIQEEDLVDTTVYSNAQLQEGDVVTVEQLLAGALIPSGGDAAKALAREVGTRLGDGSDPVERFVAEMNAVAEELGMNNSNFVNPDGADDPDQYTTARDLAIASRALVNHRLLADLVAQSEYEMTITGMNARAYELFNTNEMVGLERVQGVKTGTTVDAGECLVMLTTRGGNQILTVVMGSEDRYLDTQALLDYIDDQVTWIEFGANGTFPSIERASDRFDFAVATPLTRPILSDNADRLYTRMYLGPRPESLVPIAWGYVVFLHDGEELYRLPVVTTV